jgi:hypothetical protein
MSGSSPRMRDPAMILLLLMMSQIIGTCIDCTREGPWSWSSIKFDYCNRRVLDLFTNPRMFFYCEII